LAVCDINLIVGKEKKQAVHRTLHYTERGLQYMERGSHLPIKKAPSREGAVLKALLLEDKSAKEDQKTGTDNTCNDLADKVAYRKAEDAQNEASEEAAEDTGDDVPEKSSLAAHDRACEPAA